MINIDKISQLATYITLNSRMPSNPIIHKLACDDNAIGLLISGLEVHNHIAFIVIQPEQSNLLRKEIFRSVHCVIIKGYGVILSSNCSSVSEGILEHIAKWMPYLKLQDELQYYMKYTLRLVQ
jgi:hypothetical protein